MWDMIFFFPNSKNHRRQPFCQQDLPQTNIPARANTTSHEWNHCVSFFAQIAVFFVWLSCVRASPCHIAGSIPVALLATFVRARPPVELLVACDSPCCLQHLVLHAPPCQMLSVWIEDTIHVSTCDAGVNAAAVNQAEVNDEIFDEEKEMWIC